MHHACVLWRLVMTVMRHLQCTSDVGLTFNGSGGEDVVDVCYNSESTKAQRPTGSVGAHAGDGRPYLAQGSSM